ncbi:MAG: hypothetical protein GY798_13820 [Hyphomicrobiales bacterium]|nr:hypothetical protein [Hyphomicrobiales bacterium]
MPISPSWDRVAPLHSGRVSRHVDGVFETDAGRGQEQDVMGFAVNPRVGNIDPRRAEAFQDRRRACRERSPGAVDLNLGDGDRL